MDIPENINYPIQQTPYHRHTGFDSPKISYNDLVDIPTGEATGIGFDTSKVAGASGSATEITSYTNAGDLMIIAIIGFSGDVPTAVSYDSVALTLLTSVTNGNYVLYFYYLRGPSLGTNDVSITMTGSHGDEAIVASYYRTNQSSQFDTSTTATNTTTTSYTQSLTTGVDNAWTVMAAVLESGLTPTAGDDTIIRRFASGLGLVICDSGQAITPAASWTLTLNSASQKFDSIMVSVKPV